MANTKKTVTELEVATENTEKKVEKKKFSPKRLLNGNF